MTLDDFATRHPPQPPRRALGHDDEARRLTPAEGLMHLTVPPAAATVRATPTGSATGNQGRHLWAFLPNAIPYVLESAPLASPPLAAGPAKHTNLTGGEPACCAGELWVDAVDDSMLYVNGVSRRVQEKGMSRNLADNYGQQPSPHQPAEGNGMTR